ncbi:MAG: glycosyltransferase [Mycobacterium sp.]|nr:glycosyltransferase [Mycobacterium sp.]
MSAELPNFAPIRMLQVEIGEALPEVAATRDKQGAVYTRAWALVRLHDEPLGMIELTLPGGTLPAEVLAREIWADLGARINEHLQADGMAELSSLAVTGIPGDTRPPCLVERDRATADCPLITVIIATRNRTDSLALCLAAFDRVDYSNYEIVVVDNAPSTEDTADLIADRYATDPRIHYVREPHPGLGWAHNCGLRHAGGEFIAFTDDDVIVDRHWLRELLRGFAMGDNVGCVTGLVVPQEIETPSQYWFDTHSGFNKGFRRRVFDLAANRPDDRLFPWRSSMFGTGANMAFRATALRSVGGLDPVLGPGTLAKNGEDLDIYYRIVQAGYQLVYQPAALVNHLHRADYPALRDQFYTYGVGFTAYLTKLVVAHPLDGLRLIARIPAIIAFARRGQGTDKPDVEYPPELTRVELKGRLYGPLAYLRSRRNHRRALRRDSARRIAAQ